MGSSPEESIGGCQQCMPTSMDVANLSGPAGQHPPLQVALQEAPQPPLAFADWIRREVALARPSGDGAAMETPEELRGFRRSEESVVGFVGGCLKDLNYAFKW